MPTDETPAAAAVSVARIVGELRCRDCGELVVPTPNLSPAKKRARAWKRQQAGQSPEGYVPLYDKETDESYVMCFTCLHWRYWARKTNPDGSVK